MLNVTYKGFMLSVIMLSVVILNVVMLSVVAPSQLLYMRSAKLIEVCKRLKFYNAELKINYFKRFCLLDNLTQP